MGAAGIVGAVFKGVGKTQAAAGDFMSVYGNYLSATQQSWAMRQTADQERLQAKEYLEDATSLFQHAGNVQQAGDERTRMRTLQLGQDIGHLYAGAAGSGIDVSSATVRHVERGQRVMANADIAAMNRSTAENANTYISQTKNARLNYVNAMTDAQMLNIQADLNNKIATSNMRSGMWSAAGRTLASFASF